MTLIRQSAGGRIIRNPSGKLGRGQSCCCTSPCGTRACDCASIVPPCLSASSYRWRYNGLGDFRNCIPDCFDQVDDAIVAAGGGPGGGGIILVRTPSTSCCNFVAGSSIANCDCLTGDLTPSSAGSLTLVRCELLDGQCVTRATFATPTGAHYELIPFRLNATIGDPNIFPLITSGDCCDSPLTIEIWAG